MSDSASPAMRHLAIREFLEACRFPIGESVRNPPQQVAAPGGRWVPFTAHGPNTAKLLAKKCIPNSMNLCKLGRECRFLL